MSDIEETGTNNSSGSEEEESSYLLIYPQLSLFNVMHDCERTSPYLDIHIRMENPPPKAFRPKRWRHTEKNSYASGDLIDAVLIPGFEPLLKSMLYHIPKNKLQTMLHKRLDRVLRHVIPHEVNYICQILVMKSYSDCYYLLQNIPHLYAVAQDIIRQVKSRNSRYPFLARF